MAISTMMTSCLVTSAAGATVGVVGGAVKAVGGATGAVLGAGGKALGTVIGGKSGEIKASDAKYKFSDVEIITEDDITTITGKLSHNGVTKNNLSIAIPCFNKKGVKLGDATDTVSVLEKNETWEFTATLYEGKVNACKINDTYITSEK